MKGDLRRELRVVRDFRAYQLGSGISFEENHRADDSGGRRQAARGCRTAAAVRSTPTHREAGNRAERFLAASPFRVIS
jgi:hypothetical protein